ncbi:MAG: AAA family ATPase [bacterium]|nr:AAA family ATPase [bacterium]
MFLKRLKIFDIRSIREFDLSFEDNEQRGSWEGIASSDEPDIQLRRRTLILGQNGTGKSTILRSVALLTSGSDAVTELIDDVDSWIRLGADEARIEGELQTAQGETQEISLTFQRGSSLREFFSYNQEALDQLDSVLKHDKRRWVTIGYGVSRRISTERTFSSKARFRHQRAQCVATLFEPAAELHPIEAWAMDLDYRLGEKGLAMVKNALAKLLPGMRLDHIDKERRQLMFKTAAGMLPLSQLSDGYQNVAAWCGDLIYRLSSIFPGVTNPLNSCALLLIDEVGLHLHPTWQRKLMAFLTQTLPGLQILATTHSPLAAHQAKSNELYILHRPSPRKPPVLVEFPGVPAKMMLHQVITSPAFGLDTLDSAIVEAARSEEVPTPEQIGA